MNLTNLFSAKFLKENLKHSRALILLLIFLIPVINVIVYLMNATNSSVFTPSIVELCPLSVIGMYIMPVILSITLFSFVYKRKSSDFVMSFPVSKKQIFISNTVGGIIVIIIMNLANYLFLLISTLLLNNILLDYQMLFDLFILWTISYIFVFTCNNIAVSLSSNKITTVVVTLLVLFLVPFIHTFIVSDSFKGSDVNLKSTYCDNEICRPKNYECYDTKCEINKRNNIYERTVYYEIEDNANYTLPYALIKENIISSDTSNVNKSILKMAFLSIIYIIVGLLLFIKKKFEVVETSFKNERLHIFVRSLTTVPIICIYYIILKNSNISFSDIFTVIFLFALILAYVIIYDLLTRKKVTNIFKTLSSLIIVGIIVIFIGEISSNQEEYIDVNKITQISFENTELSIYGGYTDNKDIINYVMSIHMDNQSVGEYYKGITAKIKVDNKKYEFRISVTENQYKYIMEKLNNDKTYQKTTNKIKEKDIYAIQLNGDSGYVSKKSNLYKKIVEKFKDKSTITTEEKNHLYTAVIYIYDNYNSDTFYLYIEDTPELEELILNYYNEKTKNIFNNSNLNIVSYFSGTINDNGDEKEKYFSSYNYDYQEISKFILNNLEEKVDINKPYMYLKIYTDNYRYQNSYIFVTNKINELKSLITNIKSEEDMANFQTGDTYGKYTN